MQKYAQLSIDVTGALLENGLVDVNGRVMRFIKKTLSVRRRRRLSAPWMPGGVVEIEGGSDQIGSDLRLLIAANNASVGDRIVLVASVDPEEPRSPETLASVDDGAASLLDGAALFVLHVLERADPVTRSEMATLLPPKDTAEVGVADDRAAWRALRDEILALLVEQEVRGPASVEALSQHCLDAEMDLVILNEQREEVPAEELLRDLLAARRRPRRARRAEVDDRLYLPVARLERTLQGFPLVAGYDPPSDARALLSVLDSARETFGAVEAASNVDAVASLLRDVSRGGVVGENRRLR